MPITRTRFDLDGQTYDTVSLREGAHQIAM